MPFDLRVLERQPWLVEPNRLQLYVEQLAHLLARSAWATGGALLLDVATGATLAYVAGDTIPMPVHLGALYAGVLAAAATLAAVLCRAHLLRPDLPPTSDQERAA